MKFVGIDLTSAFAASPRAIDVAVLDARLNVRFFAVNWPKAETVIGRDAGFLVQALSAQGLVETSERVVLAIDGPQGLATVGNTMRACERTLGTPGRTPSTLPPAEESGAPFQGYIRSSVDLFAGLVGSAPARKLAGLNGVSNLKTDLWEVFPGAEWAALAGQQLPTKATAAGRQARRNLFEALGILFPTQALPTADQHDALVGAYLAWCVHHEPSSVELVGEPPYVEDGELREGFILHALARPRRDRATINREVKPAPSSSDGETGTTTELTDWSDGDALRLVLTDYGVVHGKEPENAWLAPGRDYTVETVAPHPRLPFKLVHATKFSGGRAWRAEPTVREVLRQLGYPTPAHLTRMDAVTLRVRVKAAAGVAEPDGAPDRSPQPRGTRALADVTPPTLCEELTRDMGRLFACARMDASTRIRTPFLYPDGDVIDLFVQDHEGALAITDGGETLRWLRDHAVSLELSDRQTRVIEDVCLTHGLEFVRGMLLGRVRPGERLAATTLRVAQGALRVADLCFVAQG